MANTSELEKGLNELKRLTGITLAVTAEDSEQEQMALEQIRCLCLAYREKYNKNNRRIYRQYLKYRRIKIFINNLAFFEFVYRFLEMGDSKKWKMIEL